MRLEDAYSTILAVIVSADTRQGTEIGVATAFVVKASGIWFLATAAHVSDEPGSVHHKTRQVGLPHEKDEQIGSAFVLPDTDLETARS